MTIDECVLLSVGLIHLGGWLRRGRASFRDHWAGSHTFSISRKISIGDSFVEQGFLGTLFDFAQNCWVSTHAVAISARSRSALTIGERCGVRVDASTSLTAMTMSRPFFEEVAPPIRIFASLIDFSRAPWIAFTAAWSERYKLRGTM